MAGERALTGDARELARAAGLGRGKDDPTLADLDRRRTQLWVLSTLVLVACLAGAVFLIAGRELLPDLLSDDSTSYAGAVLILALGGAFIGYTIEKERTLRKLAGFLIEERQRADRLAQVDELRRDAVATTCHDLKTPLTTIMGATKTLQRIGVEVEDGRKMEFLGSIEKQSVKMLDLINEILDTSRIESGSLQLKRQPIDLRTLTDEVVGDLSSGPLGAGRDIRVNMEPQSPGMWGDPLATQQILGNLLENALKYGHDPITVEVVDRTIEIVMSVADSGPGIPPEEIGSLFDRFKRVGSPDAEGSGLGLYIVGTLAEAQGGSVDVDSEPSSGTTFTVRFPKRASDRTVDLTTDPTPPSLG